MDKVWRNRWRIKVESLMPYNRTTSGTTQQMQEVALMSGAPWLSAKQRHTSANAKKVQSRKLIRRAVTAKNFNKQWIRSRGWTTWTGSTRSVREITCRALCNKSKTRTNTIMTTTGSSRGSSARRPNNWSTRRISMPKVISKIKRWPTMRSSRMITCELSKSKINNSKYANASARSWETKTWASSTRRRIGSSLTGAWNCKRDQPLQTRSVKGTASSLQACRIVTGYTPYKLRTTTLACWETGKQTSISYKMSSEGRQTNRCSTRDLPWRMITSKE